MFAQANLDDLQIVRHVVESLGIDYVSRPVPDTGRAFVDDKALAHVVLVSQIEVSDVVKYGVPRGVDQPELNEHVIKVIESLLCHLSVVCNGSNEFRHLLEPCAGEDRAPDLLRDLCVAN